MQLRWPLGSLLVSCDAAVEPNSKFCSFYLLDQPVELQLLFLYSHQVISKPKPLPFYTIDLESSVIQHT